MNMQIITRTFCFIKSKTTSKLPIEVASSKDATFYAKYIGRRSKRRVNVVQSKVHRFCQFKFRDVFKHNIRKANIQILHFMKGTSIGESIIGGIEMSEAFCLHIL